MQVFLLAILDRGALVASALLNPHAAQKFKESWLRVHRLGAAVSFAALAYAIYAINIFRDDGKQHRAEVHISC